MEKDTPAEALLGIASEAADIFNIHFSTVEHDEHVMVAQRDNFRRQKGERERSGRQWLETVHPAGHRRGILDASIIPQSRVHYHADTSLKHQYIMLADITSTPGETLSKESDYLPQITKSRAMDDASYSSLPEIHISTFYAYYHCDNTRQLS